MSILLGIAAVYLALVAMLYFGQRSLVFVPDKAATTPAENGVGDMSVIAVRTEDGLTLHGWYKPPVDPAERVMVFFHGNAGGLRGRGQKSRPFVNAGYGFLYAEYRGYSGNPGSPGEQGLYRDARAYIAWLKSQGIQEQQLIFYGESLGTGIAVKMASEYKHAAAIVLESPYTTLPDVAAKTYFYVPVRQLMRDKFDSLSLIGNIHTPLLVLHGEADAVVPFAQGKTLYDAAPGPKMFADFPSGTHFNLGDTGAPEKILSFLAKQDKD